MDNKELEKNTENEQNIEQQEDMVREVIETEVDPFDEQVNKSETEIKAAEVIAAEVKAPKQGKKSAASKEKEEGKEKKSATTILLILACVVLALACIVLAIKLIGAADDQPQIGNTTTVVEETTAAGNETVSGGEETAAFDREAFFAPTEGVVAKVNGVELDGSLYDFYKWQNAYVYETIYGLELSAEWVSLLGLEAGSLSNLMRNELILQLAKSQGIEVSQEDAQELRDGDIASMGGEVLFDQMLLSTNCTREQYLQYCYYYAAEQALYLKAAEGITVTDAEAKATYDADPSQYDTRKTSHILVLFDAAGDVPTDTEKQTAYNEALAILEKVKANPDNFAEIAKEYSDDGSAPAGGVIDAVFTKHDTSLYAEYVAAAWELEGVGDFSPAPVESRAGYHIIKIDEETKGFENFAEQIKEQAIDAQVQEKLNVLYSDLFEKSEFEQIIEFQYSEPLEF